MSSLRICVKRKKMYVSCRTVSWSDFAHSRRDVCRNVAKVLGGMDLMSTKLDCMIAWTISTAGENLGDVERRGGSGLVESS